MDRPEAAPTPQPLVEYDANADSEHLDNDLMLRLVTNRCMVCCGTCAYDVKDTM